MVDTRRPDAHKAYKNVAHASADSHSSMACLAGVHRQVTDVAWPNCLAVENIEACAPTIKGGWVTQQDVERQQRTITVRH